MLLFLILALPDLPAEDKLLAQARQGNQQAIAKIYEAYFDAIFQFIRWRVDDSSLAEDLTSEVFFKFLNALRSRSAPRQSLRGWLFRVARNVLHDHYRHAVVTVELDKGSEIPYGVDHEAQLISSMDAEQVRRFIRRLAVDQQEVLALRFGQTLSLQATAEAMGKSVEAVKSLQFRAISALRQMLGTAEWEADHGAF